MLAPGVRNLALVQVISFLLAHFYIVDCVVVYVISLAFRAFKEEVSMNRLIAVLVIIALSGCVSDSTQLRNDRGQVVNCANSGWGYIGAPVAAAHQKNCIKQAEAAGFKPATVADSATPPAPVAAPQPSPPPVPSVVVSPPVPAPAAQVPTPAPTPTATTAPPAASGAVTERLKKLEEVYKSGAISKDEYDKKRQEILATI